MNSSTDSKSAKEKQTKSHFKNFVLKEDFFKTSKIALINSNENLDNIPNFYPKSKQNFKEKSTIVLEENEKKVIEKDFKEDLKEFDNKKAEDSTTQNTFDNYNFSFQSQIQKEYENSKPNKFNYGIINQPNYYYPMMHQNPVMYNPNFNPIGFRMLQNQMMMNYFPRNISTSSEMDYRNMIVERQILLSQYWGSINPKKQKKKPTNKKIDIEAIIDGSDERTSLMLRNIPNKYTLESLVDEFGKEFYGKYDCLSLPIDYETKLNLGYAFINFTNPFHIIAFFTKFNLKKWSKFKSDKLLELCFADRQGKKDIALKDDTIYFAEDDKRFDFKSLKPNVLIPNVS